MLLIRNTSPLLLDLIGTLEGYTPHRIAPEAAAICSRLRTRRRSKEVNRLSNTEIIYVEDVLKITVPTTWIEGSALNGGANLLMKAVNAPHPIPICFVFKDYVFTHLQALPDNHMAHQHSLARANINIWQYDIIFLPVNYTREHWALLVFFITQKQIIYMNSVKVNLL
jgi:Ulp1 family protease